MAAKIDIGAILPPASLIYPSQAPRVAIDSVITRPRHTRRKSSKFSSEPLLQGLRTTLRRVLPQGWGSRTAFEKLALDLYITAIGLSGAHRIRNFTLTHDETLVLAIELAKIIDTSHLLLVLDPVSEQLVVIHTYILMARLDHLEEAPTVFLRNQAGQFASCRGEALQLLQAPFAFFRQVLRQSSTQVVHVADLGWSALETSCYMDVLSHWLLEHPVIVYKPLHGLPLSPDQDRAASLAIRFEGCDASYDHSLEAFQIPQAVINPDDSASADNAPRIRGVFDSKRRLSLSAIQDNIQSVMFARLNANESALFADVSCELRER